MNLNIHENGTSVRVDVSGALDAEATLAAQPVMKHVISSPASAVTVDLSEVEFIDPSGVGMIVFLFKRLSAANRQFQVTGVKGQPERLIRKLGLDGPLHVSFESRQMNQAAGVLFEHESRAS